MSSQTSERASTSSPEPHQPAAGPSPGPAADAAGASPAAGSGAAPSTATSGTGQSWLGALRTRILRANGTTLRDTLTEVLRRPDSENSIRTDEREMLLRLLGFGALRLDDIMVPRADIIAIDETCTLRELLLTFNRAGVSRVPVFHETLDDPRGMVHTKDLMRWMTSGAPVMGASAGHGPSAVPTAALPIDPARIDLSKVDLDRTIASTKLRRSVLYVPPSMPAMNLLIKMQASRMHMALVVDEYGGTDGLVTIEDLVEQIVGDIADEHDEAEAANIVRDPKLGLVAAARTPIAELETLLGVKLLRPGEEEDIDTLGGLLFALLSRVPVRGELVRHGSGIEFEVLDADPRRVKRVKIHQPRPRA